MAGQESFDKTISPGSEAAGWVRMIEACSAMGEDFFHGHEFYFLSDIRRALKRGWDLNEKQAAWLGRLYQRAVAAMAAQA